MVRNLIIPRGYRSLLDPLETEDAIKRIKDFFQVELAGALNLRRVTAPLFVRAGRGINDDLNGTARPVAFAVKDLNGAGAEIVQSLAKWKRMALAQLLLPPGEGLYTDMNAVRPDETRDNLHSLYVDQWDWERVMSRKERNLEFLVGIVKKIYAVLRKTENFVHGLHPGLEPVLPPEIRVIHSGELEKVYPELAPREREHAICREAGAVFILGIGSPLTQGRPHDGRAPDYDDWTTPTERGPGLNGDIIVWHPRGREGFDHPARNDRDRVEEKSYVSQASFGREAASFRGRRHRAVQALHVLPEKSAYRGCPVRPLAGRHDRGLPEEKDYSPLDGLPSLPGGQHQGPQLSA